ncbi:MAG TPA: hypothetical protein VFE18_19555 [Phenylobacterium sp.]|uniref:hypothetical protein n=1 Tax=Phenylobacterium sp. TaxID=1871053 RepID=UPI002D6AC558|nr:hypothetical protein [Phenylobacterium sp.]HZZ70373.1 hypothetical protein [Phenylobacterium sp.]
MSRRRSPWIGLGFDAWMLGVEASAVMAQRTVVLAAGGPTAHREALRMVAEKVDAGLALQGKALSGALGVTPTEVTARTLTHYRRKVRANRRRLARA